MEHEQVMLEFYKLYFRLLHYPELYTDEQLEEIEQVTTRIFKVKNTAKAANLARREA